MAFSHIPAENSKYSSVNLLTHFICFDAVANKKEIKRMDELRLRLKRLSKDPYKDLEERMHVAKEMYKLRCSTNCTVTSDLILFHSK
jgi:hypothetical protein